MVKFFHYRLSRHLDQYASQDLHQTNKVQYTKMPLWYQVDAWGFICKTIYKLGTLCLQPTLFWQWDITLLQPYLLGRRTWLGMLLLFLWWIRARYVWQSRYVRAIYNQDTHVLFIIYNTSTIWTFVDFATRMPPTKCGWEILWSSCQCIFILILHVTSSPRKMLRLICWCTLQGYTPSIRLLCSNLS
jgi:hypothetical protein